MRHPRTGDTVHVHFIARLDDGTIIEDSEADTPVVAVLGEGRINPAFDEALRDMNTGESRIITLPPEKAYGRYNKRLVFKLKRKKLDLKGDPKEGDFVKISLPDGKKALVTVRAIDEKKVTIDANHPHAGETIHYTLTLDWIVPAPEQEEPKP